MFERCFILLLKTGYRCVQFFRPALRRVSASSYHFSEQLLIEVMDFGVDEKPPSAKRVWPKNLTDRIAFSFTHIGLTGIILFNLFVVLPIYHKPFSFWYNFHLFNGLFIAFGVFTNLYMTILTDSTVKSSEISLPSVLMPGWYYCHNCRMNAPPRSHHCPLCDICVLKRDHHCIFTGNCVGHMNHRYFICMALYLWLGAFYTMMFDFEYFSSVLGGFGPQTWLKMVFPMVAYLLGYCTLHQLGILFVCGVCCMAMFLFTCLLSFQVFFISRGQTQFECKKKIKDYQKNFKQNWVEVLGKRWYLPVFGYFLKSRLPGDGTHFSKTTAFESNNDHVKFM